METTDYIFFFFWQYGDTFDMVESAMASFLTECQVTLSKDPANYVTDAHGKSVLKPEISDDVCSVFCHRHGHCVRGKCICDAGYAGDNCHLVAGQGPQLDRIRRFLLIAPRWGYRVRRN